MKHLHTVQSSFAKPGSGGCIGDARRGAAGRISTSKQPQKVQAAAPWGWDVGFGAWGPREGLTQNLHGATWSCWKGNGL